MLYFAYGSNLSLARMRARVPSSRVIAVAQLSRYRLMFHKVGQDGSGKCDIVSTGQPSDLVYGVVYDISPAEKPWLDRVEGLGAGYAEKPVRVITLSGAELAAVCYVATHIDAGLMPFSWYKAHVLHGAEEHGLPADYLRALGAVAAIEDSNRERHRRETGLYQ
ncbi:gamma-glutamylcyclotransferase family protein [Oceanimonas marisflavi]|uniref:gamma-glutamylcyclotransferase family protein n=1 Tax=Oceanimonas marisflavi TaxID=2059724 RepID=UPI000D3093F8|nr:gamma-glutamylcyclotransferase family protein [Oceanimonas marisflavi]